MLRILWVALLVCSVTGGNKALAGEVTDKEFDILGLLVVTYFAGKNVRVDCTAFNAAGKPIGGAYDYAAGGVARVSISVPDKYVGKNLKVKCRP